MPESTCPLCGRTLGMRFVVYSEGLFCEDGAGCRRNALRVMQGLRDDIIALFRRNDDLTNRLSFFERVDEPEGDPPEPAEGHGIDATEERL